MCTFGRELIDKRDVSESISVANATCVPVSAVGRVKLSAVVEGIYV